MNLICRNFKEVCINFGVNKTAPTEHHTDFDPMFIEYLLLPLNIDSVFYQQ